MGDLYRAGGWTAVLVGMAMLGAVLRLLYGWLAGRGDRTPGEVFEWSSILHSLNFEYYFGPVFPALTRRIPVNVLVLGCARLTKILVDRFKRT